MVPLGDVLAVLGTILGLVVTAMLGVIGFFFRNKLAEIVTEARETRSEMSKLRDEWGRTHASMGERISRLEQSVENLKTRRRA